MAFNYSPKIVTDGLVLYLDAANPNSYVSGSTTWRDISRGGNNGTLVNGPTFDPGNGGSIVFDGVDDFASVNVINNQISLGVLNFTLSVWYNNNSTNNYHHLYNIQDQNNFAWKANNTSIGEVYFFGGNNYRSLTNSFGVWNLDFNVWNQHTLVRDGLNFYGYKNGIYIGSSTTSFIKNITGLPIYLGSNGTATSERAAHKRTLQVVYNRALTPEEILQNYNATKTRFGLT